MFNKTTQWEKVRPQFDALPYPNQPLESTPKNDPGRLAAHNLVISHYLRYQWVLSSEGKWILDAGCGSGAKLLALALANPGAHLVGIDISEKSLDLAQKRLEYHGLQDRATFHCLPIEELPTLPYTFDYINCDDVLYLLADPAEGLKAMKAVLKPQGIIRANMHSAIQRAGFYRIQEFFTRLGCLEGSPTEEEMAVTRETMKTLHDWVMTKKQTWVPEFETDDERLLMNYLFRGDVGITMRQFSEIMARAEVEFIHMVHWRQWNLEELFKNLEELPLAVALNIAEMTLEEQLYLFELLHPVHRLLDLYCGHPGQGRSRPPLDEWIEPQWQTARVHFHPQLCRAEFQEILEAGARQLGMIDFDQFLPLDNKPMNVDSTMAACLYPLLDGSQTFSALVQRWLQTRPLDLITLQPADSAAAFELLRQALIDLERAGYVLIELAD
jgi:ubiquinone/menaquinone biosynthesis C-methylase UbiE